MAANRVVAINSPIDDTDPIRKFNVDPGSQMDKHNPAEFSPKAKLIRNFSIDPASSIRTRLQTPFVGDAVSETSSVNKLKALHLNHLRNPQC